jgi:hypothetical protein
MSSRSFDHFPTSSFSMRSLKTRSVSSLLEPMIDSKVEFLSMKGSERRKKDRRCLTICFPIFTMSYLSDKNLTFLTCFNYLSSIPFLNFFPCLNCLSFVTCLTCLVCLRYLSLTCCSCLISSYLPFLPYLLAFFTCIFVHLVSLVSFVLHTCFTSLTCY